MLQTTRDLAKSYGNVGYTLAQIGLASEGLETYQKSVQIIESLYQMNPSSVCGMRDVAISYAYFGDVYTFLGKKKQAATAVRIEYFNQAKAYYERSRKMYVNLRERGALKPVDSEKPKNLADEISQCEAAISRLKNN